MKTRYAIIGTGGRSGALMEPIIRDYPDQAELVAFCDQSTVRMQHWQTSLSTRFRLPQLPHYTPDQLENMLQAERVDTLLICTPDATHDEYMVRALNAGVNVITEKPMTTTAEKCRRILEARERSGKSVRVTFNYRWIPVNTLLRDLLISGIIGRIRHVSMIAALDTRHGADYFRRWHSEKSISGGLQIHKSTHHFDLLNWWCDSIPETVMAQGGLLFYGKENAIARGEPHLTAYDRYTGTDSQQDPFRLDLDAAEGSRSLYRAAEAETGYIRDRNVHRDGIDIEDSLDVLIRSRCGIQFNYTLQAFMPYEGLRVWFTGDKGVLELTDMGGSHIIMGQSDEELAALQDSEGWIKQLIHRPLFGEAKQIDVPTAEGSHGGGDRALFRDIYDRTAEADQFGRGAGCEQGAASMLVGDAVNASLETKREIRISDRCCFCPQATHLHELTH